MSSISFSVKKGEIFGLLGPNGAGKTTLVSILSTLIQPTSGYATIYGLDIRKNVNVKKIKPKIGLMLGDEMVYFRMTGIDNLKFFTRIYRIKNSKEKIAEIGARRIPEVERDEDFIIMTHCHSSVVTGILLKARRQSKSGLAISSFILFGKPWKIL